MSRHHQEEPFEAEIIEDNPYQSPEHAGPQRILGLEAWDNKKPRKAARVGDSVALLPHAGFRHVPDEEFPSLLVGQLHTHRISLSLGGLAGFSYTYSGDPTTSQKWMEKHRTFPRYIRFLLGPRSKHPRDYQEYLVEVVNVEPEDDPKITEEFGPIWKVTYRLVGLVKQSTLVQKLGKEAT